MTRDEIVNSIASAYFGKGWRETTPTIRRAYLECADRAFSALESAGLIRTEMYEEKSDER